jgi:hypothetical protein
MKHVRWPVTPEEQLHCRQFLQQRAALVARAKRMHDPTDTLGELALLHASQNRWQSCLDRYRVVDADGGFVGPRGNHASRAAGLLKEIASAGGTDAFEDYPQFDSDNACWEEDPEWVDAILEYPDKDDESYDSVTMIKSIASCGWPHISKEQRKVLETARTECLELASYLGRLLDAGK